MLLMTKIGGTRSPKCCCSLPGGGIVWHTVNTRLVERLVYIYIYIILKEPCYILLNGGYLVYSTVGIWKVSKETVTA